MESAFAAIGLMSIISVVDVVEALASADGGGATALAASGSSLVKTYDWAFQWGPGLVAGIGNGLMLGYLMYRSALVPPRMALLGLIGGTFDHLSSSRSCSMCTTTVDTFWSAPPPEAQRERRWASTARKGWGSGPIFQTRVAMDPRRRWSP
jgi:hypothetical protein